MRPVLLSPPRKIMSSPGSVHGYFGWPSLIRLKNGALAAAASGFRIAHICPFGKAVLSFSHDEGETFSLPAPVIDTCLDDRDAGLCAFGKSGLIVTSFNNTVAFQRKCTPAVLGEPQILLNKNYVLSYLDLVTPEQEKEALGSTFRVSFDNGITFGPLYHSPVTSPHGPIELQNGSVLWVGAVFGADESVLRAYTLDPETGETEFVGELGRVIADGVRALACEPFTIELPDGTLLCHIRVECMANGRRIYTIFQSVSHDGGRTWSESTQLLEDEGGAPDHLLLHSSGALIMTYTHRTDLFGIKLKISTDGGESWEDCGWIYENTVSKDLGYPETVELSDGSLLTVFYARENALSPAEIYIRKWKLEP